MTINQQSDDEARYDVMVANLDYLIDVNYEDKIRGRLKRAIKHHFNILNARVLYSRKNPNSFHLDDVLDRAMDANLISENEEYDLMLIDFILLGQSQNSEPTYVAIESSVTIKERDIDRAARRSHILQTASGIPTQTAVIGTAISDVNREYADRSGVTVIITAK